MYKREGPHTTVAPGISHSQASSATWPLATCQGFYQFLVQVASAVGKQILALILYILSVSKYQDGNLPYDLNSLMDLRNH